MGEVIRRLRKEKGLTQKELSKLVGISSTVLCQYETGARKPKIDKLDKIAEVFNVSADYLRGNDVNESDNMISIPLTEYKRLKDFEQTILNEVKKYKKG